MKESTSAPVATHQARPEQRRKVRRVWLDLGDPGALLRPGDPLNAWQDHGLGLLRTIMHQADLTTDIVSTRRCRSLEDLQRHLSEYDQLFMNVRSWTFAHAQMAARIFKRMNPRGLVIVGGMHATVALDEMTRVQGFDHICCGPGEGVIVALATDPNRFPRIIEGIGARSMSEWPRIDRTLWPRPGWRLFRPRHHWPLEADPNLGWGPSPVATVLTSGACPWRCAFCNESSYLPPIGRKTVDDVIDELNHLDDTYGVGSVVIHDSLFFQGPRWLEEWLDKYPRRANKLWPYWAAARSDTVRRWPDLFEALVRETNWRTVSVGFESASDRVLKILNKECSAEDNYFTIDLLNRIGDDMEAHGKTPPRFWCNIIWGTVGERPEDAFETMAMLRYTRRLRVSASFFAPYPGTALGYQLIGEGKSLMTSQDYTRTPGDEKVVGVDYSFYRDLISGRYEAEVQECLRLKRVERDKAAGGVARSGLGPRHSFYLFDMSNGKKKLAYGTSPDDALETLSFRLTEREMSEIAQTSFEEVGHRTIPHIAKLLG